MNGYANGHTEPQSYDTVVIGAGISGINAAYRVQEAFPESKYTVLEGRHELGGTWSLFKYPGLRSDSDLHTFGFPFNPWEKPNPIATGASISEYMHETAVKFGIDRKIQYGHQVESANWSSDEQRWRVAVNNEGARKILYTKWLIMGTGYYDYEKPLQADIPGLDNFKGKKVHPQFWPENLKYQDKKVVVIGSGATTITLLPALVDTGVGQVTMLQRSPSYVMNLPQRKSGDPLPFFERFLPRWMSLRLTRLQFIVIPWLFYLFCRQFPNAAANLLRREAKGLLPKDFVMDPHFKPAYNPWDQRLCLCPDADFFKCFESGRAQIVTATIKTVLEDGILLDSGEKLAADIIITATGLKLQFLGKVQLSVDKNPVTITDAYTWRTTMLTGVPNLGLILGYVNASWTLGSDSCSRLLVRLMKFMDDKKYTSATPKIDDSEIPEVPLLPLSLSSTYFESAKAISPKSGRTGPWAPRESYIKDNWVANRADLRKGLQFGRVAT